MAPPLPPSVGAASRALYRSLLRTACRMPDDHRRAFVVHRTRSEFEQSRALSSPEEISARRLEGEIYRDQLEHQAEHLTLLAAQQTLIPVDLRSFGPSAAVAAPSPTPPPSSTARGPSRPSGPSRPTRQPRTPSPPSPHPPSPSPLPLDRRKLLRAISARDENRRLGVGLKGRNRFMEGPEPSWVRKRREREDAAERGGSVRESVASHEVQTPSSAGDAQRNEDKSASRHEAQEGTLDDLADAPAGNKKGVRFWLIFLGLLLATFEAALEQTALATALPTMAADLSTGSSNEGDFSWIANVYMLTSAAFIPWAGGLCNLFGRRPIMLLALFLFTLGSIICAVAKDLNTMLAGRGIQGAGGGIIFVVVEVILSDIVPLAERGVYQGAFSATWSVASAAGPLVGGAFSSFNWRWLFWVNLPLSAAVTAVVMLFMKLKKPEGTWREKIEKMDWLGNFLFIPSMSVLILGLVWGGSSYPWRSAQVIAPIICGALGLLGWFFVEKHYVKYPTVPFAALMNRTSVVGFLTTGFHGVVAMAVYYMWPAYFQSAKADSTIASAVNFLPVVCIVSPMAMLTGLSINGWQHYKAQNIAGWILLTIGVGLLSLTTATTSKAGWVLLPMVSALGIGINYAAPVFAVLAPLAPALAGQGLAFQMLIRTFGNVLGIAIGSTVLSNVLGKELPQAFLDSIPRGAAGAYDAIPEIRHLEEPLKMQVQEGFASALRVVWLVMIPFAGIGFVISLFMHSLPLASTTDETFGVKESKRDASPSGRSTRSRSRSRTDELDALEKADEEQRAAGNGQKPNANMQQVPLPAAEAVAAERV
ncbi:hypothetical protein JCM6882_001311 [Rhodosporidiobolus microsporus]